MIDAHDTLIDDFRQAMRRVASTVNVISICVEGEAMGITATAVSPISMAPPSLLVCINRTSSVHPSMADMSHFGVNVLHRDQAEVARMFADRSQLERRFALGWEVGPDRPPRLIDAQATILCRRIDHHQFGTHSIFIGVVEEVTTRAGVDPLLYLDGAFGGVVR